MIRFVHTHAIRFVHMHAIRLYVELSASTQKKTLYRIPVKGFALLA
ncbi:hypothetical protein CEB3_c40530 [Peptococcaceae bacterium CEB3]|nr:hypothetical protein CEB3_c40530 [Peptococcaceae bacterium CEB3]